MVGRFAERSAVDQLLAAAQSDLSGVLVLHGEAGIGKTTLLDHAESAALAAGFTVVRLAGFESERDLAFAGVHRIMAPFLPLAADLPVRQRCALESAFGLAEGPPVDRFLVGLAMLSVLERAAATAALLCIVDDAQWLDDESLGVLAFTARRLWAERVVMLFGVRSLDRHQLPLDGLPSMRLDGLPLDDAAMLLRAVADGPVSTAVCEQLVAATNGSPLALVELAGGLTAEQIAFGVSHPESLPIGQRLEGHYLGQVRALPEETQRLLLIAAAEMSGTHVNVRAAAEALVIPFDRFEQAENAGLVTIRPAIRFRHPLLRTAVYNAALPSERRQVHHALAEAAGRTGQLDQRAWHLGVAADRPDEETARELEIAAERALGRGGCAASAAFFTRAAELSPDPSDRVERALAAAQRHLVAGFRVRARDVLAEFASDVDDPLQHARAKRLDGAIRYATGETSGTVSTLLEATAALAPLDVPEARSAALQALAAARIAGEFGTVGESELDVSRAARALVLPPGTAPTVGDLLLDGDVALFLDGHAAAVPLLRHALAALEADRSTSAEMLWWLSIGCWAAGVLADDEALRRIATRAEGDARAHGAMVPLTNALMFLGLAELFDGELPAARRHLEERAELMEAIGRPSDVGPLVALAWTGAEESVRSEATRLVEYAQSIGHGWMLAFASYAISVLELGLGNYTQAFHVSSKYYEENPFLRVAVFPNLVEAAVRCGERAAAEDAIADFASRVLIDPTPLALGLVACGRALLADDGDASRLYTEALDHLGSTAGELPSARVRLLYGEWLRRQNRRIEARTHLRAAHESFCLMGAIHFAERARQELAATGERVHRHGRRTDLTSQESRIALLASTGSTNQEIANQLYLSASTVDYHLRKVYRKLNVESRRQLARALSA